MAYTTAGGKLYIQGGSTSSQQSSAQFFSLDLATNWSATTPSWKALSLGSGAQSAPVDSGHSMSVSVDQNNLIFWGTNTGVSTYSIPNDNWSVISSSQPAGLPASAGKYSTGDPKTGEMYKLTVTQTGTPIFISYNTITNTTKTLSLPSDLTTRELRYYSMVWSTQRNSVLLFGGYFNTTNVNNATGLVNPSFYEYNPTTDIWTDLPTTGNVPGGRFSHCMVPAYNGTKMILFGGQDTSNNPTNSIYILDLSNQTWTMGNNIDISLSRNGGACASYGDNFVGWGGNYLGTLPSQLSTVVIYNLKFSQWTTQYTVPASIIPSTNSTSTIGTSSPVAADSPDDSSKSNSTTAPIVGGVVAGVLVLAIGGYFIRRRLKSAKDGSAEGEAPMKTQSSQLPKRLEICKFAVHV
ncbi:hypothetical protein BGZ79_006596 [Entomortierella chlamydospora]|nr:hypothetical protein BGZ79_006596 [Entomortierella chlamydospora]